VTVNSTWTDPTTLDKAVGATLPSADLDKMLSDLLHLGGTDGNGRSQVTKTGDYTILTTDGYTHVYANKATAITITLPSAAASTNRQITIKSIGAGACTIARAGADTIDGATSQTLAQFDSMTLISDGGTDWRLT